MAGSLGSYEEHHLKRIIPGDVETVGKRISDVLEEFNYVVLGENPIQAKRNRTKSVLAATILEYHGRLTIGLKQISEASTAATFDYSVPYLFTKGDRQALEREAEAIIALASASRSQTICASCGLESAGAVRFCRSCGAPVARNKLPPEIEIMQMTASASASQQEIIFGLIITLLTLAVSLPMVLGSDGKAVNIGWVLLGIGGLLAFLTLQQGLRRLHRTMNPQAGREQALEVAPSHRVILSSERAALPPQPMSVVEGTTELMNPQQAPLSASPARNTDSME